MNLEQTLTKLKQLGYNAREEVIIGGSSNRICVSGEGSKASKYYKAKKAKADSIVSGLKFQGFDAVAEKCKSDGYFNFYVIVNLEK